MESPGRQHRGMTLLWRPVVTYMKERLGSKEREATHQFHPVKTICMLVIQPVIMHN